MSTTGRAPSFASSPLIWILPAMCAFVALAFAYLNVFVIGDEKRVHDSGLDAQARVVRLWQEEDRGKGKKRKLSYVHLAWRAKSGADMEHARLSIAGDTYTRLLEAQAKGITTTPILYDPTGRNSTPFLVVDGKHRIEQWQVAQWAMWGFTLLAVLLSWFIIRKRRT